MVRLSLAATVAALLILLTACTPTKTAPSVPQYIADTVFGVPYFPQKLTELAGHPVTDFGKRWTEACVYGPELFNDKERALFAELQPAGGEGKVGVGFSGDFDGDGKVESVLYGAYAKGTAESGNFVAVLRTTGSQTEIVLVHEYVQEPRITAFTLKPDNTLYFGGGIVDSEVSESLSWSPEGPVVSALAME